MTQTTVSPLDMAALDGRTVTEAHARVCAERGHAAHTRDGKDMGVCPRCGEVTAPANFVEDIKAFERILQLEANLHSRKVAAAFAPSDWERARALDYMKGDRDALYAALDALAPEQAKAFGEYRKSN